MLQDMTILQWRSQRTPTLGESLKWSLQGFEKKIKPRQNAPTFGTFTVVAVGPVPTLGTIEAGGAGTLVNVNLTRLTGEACRRRFGIILSLHTPTELSHRLQQRTESHRHPDTTP